MEKTPYTYKVALVILSVIFLLISVIAYFNIKDIISPDVTLQKVIWSVALIFVFLTGPILIFYGIGKLHEVFLEPHFDKKLKCSVCGKSGSRDILSEGMDDRKPFIMIGHFCREHLIERFSNEFKKSPYKIVILEFQPNASDYTGHVYGYYPLSVLGLPTGPSSFRSTFWTLKDKEIIEGLLESIKNKKCSICHKQATVLFVSKEVVPQQNTPKLDFEEKGEYLCKDHAISKVIPNIKNNSKYFDDAGGLFIPHKEDGFMATTEL